MYTDAQNRVGTVLRKFTETTELNVRLERGNSGRTLLIATREFYGPGQSINGWLTLNADDLHRVTVLFSEMFTTAFHAELDGPEPIEFEYDLEPSREHGKPHQLRILVFLHGGYRTVCLRLFTEDDEGDWFWANEECMLGVGELYQIFEALEDGTMWNIREKIYR
jgi:hypothetical protein